MVEGVRKGFTVSGIQQEPQRTAALSIFLASCPGIPRKPKGEARILHISQKEKLRCGEEWSRAPRKHPHRWPLGWALRSEPQPEPVGSITGVGQVEARAERHRLPARAVTSMDGPHHREGNEAALPLWM